MGAFVIRIYLRLLDIPAKFHESRRTIKAPSLKREPEYRPCQWQNRAGAGSMRQRVFEQLFVQIRLCRIADKVLSIVKRMKENATLCAC